MVHGCDAAYIVISSSVRQAFMFHKECEQRNVNMLKLLVLFSTTYDLCLASHFLPAHD